MTRGWVVCSSWLSSCTPFPVLCNGFVIICSQYGWKGDLPLRAAGRAEMVTSSTRGFGMSTCSWQFCLKCPCSTTLIKLRFFSPSGSEERLQVIKRWKLLSLLLSCHTWPRRVKQQLGSHPFNNGLPKGHPGLQEWWDAANSSSINWCLAVE